MKLMRPLCAALLVVALAGPVLHGCASREVSESDPAELYKEAEEDLNSDHYQLAIDKFRKVRNKFPYSKQAVDAQIRIADVYFLQESFAEAALAYETFRDLHPRHERASYAMFRIGKSHFNDVPSTVARDLTPAQRSLDAYADFLKRFPKDPQAEEARSDTAKLRTMMADKELYVAEFYFKREDYEAARGRYQKVIDLYPDTDTAKTARDRLATAIEKLKTRPPLKQRSGPNAQPIEDT